MLFPEKPRCSIITVVMSEDRAKTLLRGELELPSSDPTGTPALERESDLRPDPGADPQTAALLLDPTEPGSGPPVAGAADGSPPMPSIVLAAAGLAVFDSVIVVVYLALWAMNPESALAVIDALGGVSFLLGIAPIIVGGIILHKNKRAGGVTAGNAWANAGVVAGALLAMVTMLIPFLVALRSFLGTPPDSL